MMKHMMFLVVAIALVTTPAFAAKRARHCVDKANKEISLTGVSGKTPAAQCKTAGGKWVTMKTTATKAKAK